LALTVSIYYASVYPGLEIKGNLGLKSNILDLNPLGITPREGSSPSLGTFENPNGVKGYGKKNFSHAVRLGKGNIKGKVARPLKERSDS